MLVATAYQDFMDYDLSDSFNTLEQEQDNWTCQMQAVYTTPNELPVGINYTWYGYNIPVTICNLDGGQYMNMISELELKNKNLNKIHEYATLKYNWNGNDADPFEKELLDQVEALIHTLERQPEVFPTARDSIQFEYYFKNPDEGYLEFEIYLNKIEVYMRSVGQPSREYDISFSEKEINRVVGEFYGQCY